MPRPRKAWQKITFWLLIGIIAFGLVGSSVVGLWGLGHLDQLPASPEPAGAQNQLAGTLRELEQRVQADPEDIASRIELAVYYKQMLDLERAAALFEEVLALDASNQRARVDLAEICFIKEDYDGAEAHLAALLRINPDHQLGLYLYALTLGFGQEDYQRAVQVLERYLALANTGPDAEHARELLADWKERAER